MHGSVQHRPVGDSVLDIDSTVGRYLTWLNASQPVASYSAGRDIPAKLIPEPSTGTKLDITANDQIRPIATTTAIPTIHVRICIPSTSR